jgi:hypothetical protein
MRYPSLLVQLSMLNLLRNLNEAKANSQMQKTEAEGWFVPPNSPAADLGVSCQEGRGVFPWIDGSDFGCRQSLEAADTGPTSTVTIQINLPTFTSTEIRTPAKCGSHHSHFHQALALRPGSFERLNGWSARTDLSC